MPTGRSPPANRKVKFDPPVGTPRRAGDAAPMSLRLACSQGLTSKGLLVNNVKPELRPAVKNDSRRQSTADQLITLPGVNPTHVRAAHATASHASASPQPTPQQLTPRRQSKTSQTSASQHTTRRHLNPAHASSLHPSASRHVSPRHRTPRLHHTAHHPKASLGATPPHRHHNPVQFTSRRQRTTRHSHNTPLLGVTSPHSATIQSGTRRHDITIQRTPVQLSTSGHVTAAHSTARHQHTAAQLIPAHPSAPHGTPRRQHTSHLTNPAHYTPRRQKQTSSPHVTPRHHNIPRQDTAALGDRTIHFISVHASASFLA
jgi:hypothetical protein